MKKIIVSLLVLVFTFCLTGCGDNKVYDTVFEIKNWEKIVSQLKEVSKEDAELLNEAVYATKGDNPSYVPLEGETVRNILDLHKQWKAGKTIRLLIHERERKKNASKLETMVTAVIKAKRSHKEGYFNEYTDLVVEFTNNTEKPIKAFEGIFYVRDLFDAEIRNLKCSETKLDNFNTDYVLKATLSWECNPFIQDHEKLNKLGLDELKIVWKTKKILFFDGTVVTK